jgi:hypothetical protein
MMLQTGPTNDEKTLQHPQPPAFIRPDEVARDQPEAESDRLKSDSPNLYQILTEGGSAGPDSPNSPHHTPYLRPNTIAQTNSNPYAWMQTSRSRRRRHNSPLMASLAADPNLMASAGIVPSPTSTSSTLASPTSNLGMLNLGSPQFTAKIMLPALPNAPVGREEPKFYSRRNSSPLILPLDLAPEERTDEVWVNEMLKSRMLYLDETKDIDWENITVVEMKSLLRKYGLNSQGKKTLLADRIKEARQRLGEMDVDMVKKSWIKEFPSVENGKIDELAMAAEEKSRQEQIMAGMAPAPEPNHA